MAPREADFARSKHAPISVRPLFSATPAAPISDVAATQKSAIFFSDAQLAEQRSELKEEMSSLRVELKQDIQAQQQTLRNGPLREAPDKWQNERNEGCSSEKNHQNPFSLRCDSLMNF
ncbi:MAG: hypothetical protein HS115_01295 [Spirochaetales bacterium]|nr:hypothetical protein [Spirochaetales bacterium]